MHRNTYINSPGLLNAAYRMITKPDLYFAGQITGVEGYVESASSGLVAGINAALQSLGREQLIFPEDTAIGSLAAYVSGNSTGKLQPMNASFGLISTPGQRFKNKKEKYQIMADIALKRIEEIKASFSV
jgi:methylenetetrahydrofolate--tRNA-(uracil-5-)-methyltransferase